MSDVESHEITTVKDLLPLLRPPQDETVGPLFRGHRDAGWQLIPRLFRQTLSPLAPTWSLFEARLLDSFWRRAVAIVRKPSTPADQRAVAQHYGLPTRMLDWSQSPLVALAFAVTGADVSNEPDGMLWEIKTSAATYGDLAAADRLEDTGHVVKYFPPHVSPRITAQRACFTIHRLPERAQPFVALERSAAAGASGLQLRRFQIPAAAKGPLRRELSALGFGPAELFPDLDGFARAAIAEADGSGAS